MLSIYLLIIKAVSRDKMFLSVDLVLSRTCLPAKVLKGNSSHRTPRPVDFKVRTDFNESKFSDCQDDPDEPCNVDTSIFCLCLW